RPGPAEEQEQNRPDDDRADANAEQAEPKSTAQLHAAIFAGPGWGLRHPVRMSQPRRCEARKRAAASVATTVNTTFSAFRPRSFDSPPARGAMFTGTSS